MYPPRETAVSPRNRKCGLLEELVKVVVEWRKLFVLWI